MRINLYYVYILTNQSNTVVYIGITNDLIRRVHEHKKKLTKGFTSKYNVNKLVYFEIFEFPNLAIAREKQLKAYSRPKKNNLINQFNSNWDELYFNGVILKPDTILKEKTKSQSNFHTK
jgi:putative endonuclease